VTDPAPISEEQRRNERGRAAADEVMVLLDGAARRAARLLADLRSEDADPQVVVALERTIAGLTDLRRALHRDANLAGDQLRLL